MQVRQSVGMVSLFIVVVVEMNKIRCLKGKLLYLYKVGLSSVLIH